MMDFLFAEERKPSAVWNVDASKLEAMSTGQNVGLESHLVQLLLFLHLVLQRLNCIMID